MTNSENNFFFQNFSEKIFYGQNASIIDIDEVGKEGSAFSCFQSSSKRVLKRKHAELEEVAPPEAEKKSIFATIGQKLGFTKRQAAAPLKSVLSPNSRNRRPTPGKLDLSYEHDDFAVTNMERELEHDFPPKKRVKFDEENLIVSSITYQRQTEAERSSQCMFNPKHDEHKSFFTKFIDFTANLF